MSNNPTRYIKSVAHQPVDPGIHGQIVDSMSNTTDKRTNAPSIRMAMSNGLPAGAIVEYTGNEVPDGYRRRDDIPTLSELNDKLTAENDEEFDFAYDETTQKYGFRVGGVFMPFTSVDYPEITKISEQQATTQTTQNFQLTAKRELIFMNSYSEGTAWSSSCTSSDATVTTIAKWEGTYRQDYAIYQIEGEIGDAYTVSFNRGNCNIVRLLVN